MEITGTPPAQSLMIARTASFPVAWAHVACTARSAQGAMAALSAAAASWQSAPGVDRTMNTPSSSTHSNGCSGVRDANAGRAQVCACAAREPANAERRQYGQWDRAG